MPVIARLDGIIIKMYYRQKEHNPPHIHALDGEYMGVFSIDDGNMMEGDLPIKHQQLVKEFVCENRDELLLMWKKQNFKVL